MTSKVPKFGAWGTGDENYTVYFDKARGTKHNGMKINPNDPEENPDMFRPIKGSAQTQPQTQTQTRADKKRQQAKVPHFGAWDNGDSSGYTQSFENVRKDKLGGPAAAAAAENEPQMNRDMPGPSVHAQAQVQSQAQAAQPQIQTRADKPKTQATVPHFGAWDNGDSSGYTQTFEKVRKYRLGDPAAAENGPQMNRDMAPQSGPSVHDQAQARSQAQAQPASKEGRPKVPQFGDWEREGGGSYTRVFDDLKKKHPYSNEPQPNRDVGPTPQEGRGKAPEFGDWEGGEAVQYTEYFERPSKIKNPRTVQNPAEPQINRDVSQGPPVASRDRQGRPSAGAQVAPVYPNANLQPRPPSNRENQPTTIPHFGGWNSDPSQAEGYTGEFTRAKEERRTPVNPNVPQPYHQPHRYNKQKQQLQPSCCTIL